MTLKMCQTKTRFGNNQKGKDLLNKNSDDKIMATLNLILEPRCVTF